MRRFQHLLLSIRPTIAPVQLGLSVATLFLVILAPAFLGPGAAALEAPPVFLTKWGSPGSGDGQFAIPRGVAVDGSGSFVYVGDSANDRIQKFDSSGAFLTKWGSNGFGDGQMRTPDGVAVDGSGNVYVADLSNHRMQKFTSSGAFLIKWGRPDFLPGSGDGEFSAPRGVAVDGSGNVYVADQGNSRIQKFTSSGAFLTKWGSFGSGDGEFNFPDHVAVDGSGNVYVADQGNRRIQKFDSSGAFLTKWGSPGSGDGQFNQPSGVAVDSSGNVYVGDIAANSRIQKFDSSGAFLTKWGSFGTGDGEFSNPRGVAVDGSGNVYVADAGNDRIQKFGPPDLPPDLQGSVAVGGAPVVGTEVKLKNRVTKVVTTTTTDAAGAYQFDPVASGSYKIVIGLFEVGAPTTVSGNLTVKGAPSVGTKVKLKNLDTGVVLKTTTDASGNFSFVGVTAGTHKVIIPTVPVP